MIWIMMDNDMDNDGLNNMIWIMMDNDMDNDGLNKYDMDNNG
jgi:hypothetical protein